MWDFDDYVAKARLYFQRGAAQPQDDDDDAMAIWMVQGLEFLLRAVLAKTNPLLLAEQNSLLHAAGYPQPGSAAIPRSVRSHVVLERVAVVVPGFTEYQQDAQGLFDIRNAEAHSSQRPFAAGATAWLPRFTRCVEALCNHLNLDAGELVGGQVMRLGRALVDAEDDQLRRDVTRRIQAAQELYSQLQPEEVQARRIDTTESDWEDADDWDEEEDLPLTDAEYQAIAKAAASMIGLKVLGGLRDPGERSRADLLGWLTSRYTKTTVSCPACSELAVISGQAVRATEARVEGEELVREIISVLDGLACPVCELRLNTTAELRCAGLTQEVIVQESTPVNQPNLSQWSREAVAPRPGRSEEP